MVMLLPLIGKRSVAEDNDWLHSSRQKIAVIAITAACSFLFQTLPLNCQHVERTEFSAVRLALD
jgi:hypothetical protein